MNAVFYISSAVAIISTIMVITRLHAVHALLYFIVSLLSVALIFFILGAPFIASLEVIIYAGAIMVLFIFAIMMLNLGPQMKEQEKPWINIKMWTGPIILSLILIGEIAYMLSVNSGYPVGTVIVGPKQVGISLFTFYLLGVELASLLLLAGIIGAYQIGRRRTTNGHKDIKS
jgi:NADH-quinone oxidoreductase subunit J